MLKIFDFDIDLLVDGFALVFELLDQSLVLLHHWPSLFPFNDEQLGLDQLKSLLQNQFIVFLKHFFMDVVFRQFFFEFL